MRLDALNATQLTPALNKVWFLKKSKITLTNYHVLPFWSKILFFESFLGFFQKREIIRSRGFLRCVQCIKTLLMSY